MEVRCIGRNESGFGDRVFFEHRDDQIRPYRFASLRGIRRRSLLFFGSCLSNSALLSRHFRHRSISAEFSFRRWSVKNHSGSVHAFDWRTRAAFVRLPRPPESWPRCSSGQSEPAVRMSCCSGAMALIALLFDQCSHVLLLNLSLPSASASCRDLHSPSQGSNSIDWSLGDRDRLSSQDFTQGFFEISPERFGTSSSQSQLVIDSTAVYTAGAQNPVPLLPEFESRQVHGHSCLLSFTKKNGASYSRACSAISLSVSSGRALMAIDLHTF